MFYSSYDGCSLAFQGIIFKVEFSVQRPLCKRKVLILSNSWWLDILHPNNRNELFNNFSELGGIFASFIGFGLTVLFFTYHTFWVMSLVFKIFAFNFTHPAYFVQLILSLIVILPIDCSGDTLTAFQSSALCDQIIKACKGKMQLHASKSWFFFSHHLSIQILPQFKHF